jgi:hypothetical protein
MATSLQEQLQQALGDRYIDLQSFLQMARLPEHAERYARGLHRGQEATERRLASYLGMTPEELSRVRREADER